ncbi:MAG: diacylglycerol kinase family protein [Chthoniobacter sp.]|uniref:diacylglycerol kinase family protein n=1 Tax=Chthoniobacter sp. TaxID=2510640 RepID=UPI0032A4BE32
MHEPPPANRPAWRRICLSFVWAGRGVLVMIRTQSNAQIHAVAALGVVIAGFFFGISRGEWCAVVGAIGLVLTAEGINTAIEAVVDLASPERHPLAERAKDVAAGAVLLAALAALVIGLLIFGPHVLALLGH